MDIKHNLVIKASVNTVYNAVATQNGINGWWSKDCKVGEAVGEKSILNFDKQGKIVTMGFLTKELVPNKKVVWECIENGNPAWLGTKIITEITERNDGADVIFTHADFDEKWAGQDPFEMTKQGWEHFVNSLVSYCETGAGQPW
jgi:uncharacterized protein YndB with AHSA1/START domain